MLPTPRAFAEWLAHEEQYQLKQLYCTTSGQACQSVPLCMEVDFMKKRVNTAFWVEKEKRWCIAVQKNGTRKRFYSSTPGRTGQREANAKADAWLDDSIRDGRKKVASTYSEADAKIAAYSYDCILLDIMLPDGNGLQLLKHLKELRKRENIIIISARDSLDDKILGLDMGADDYLPKPFHTAELLARIKSVLRRGKSGGEMALILGNVSLEPESSRVLVNNKELSLLKKEFDILFYFMQRPNHLVDKSVLAEAVWGDHADQADNFHFVYAQMKNLRRKLIDAGANIEIKAIYGFGYKLVPPIE